MQRCYHLKQSKRRGIQFVLPRVPSETLRLNFWYRAPFRSNLLAKIISITDPTSIKNKLLTLTWKKFNSAFNEDIICTYSFICSCDTCRKTMANFNKGEILPSNRRKSIKYILSDKLMRLIPSICYHRLSNSFEFFCRA